YPRAPITLKEKVATTQLLLACGADIRELNTLRKHVSEVKGGGLLRRARVPLATLIISDVVGDDPGIIGSAPTLPRDSTFAEPYRVLERYRLVGRVPPAVSTLLRAGVAGRVADTTKPHRAGAAPACRIIGSNRTALEGAARMARANGYALHVEEQPL